MKDLIDLLKESIGDKIVNIEGDNIHVIGVGVYTYDSLKKNVQRKVQDLEKRLISDDVEGIGRNDLDVLARFWVALVEYKKTHQEEM